MLLAAAALCAALCSCGGGTANLPAGSGSVSKLTVDVTREYGINADGVQLALSGPDSAVRVDATGLSNTKALYGKLHYDPATQSFAGSTQLDDRVLFVAFDDPAAGYVEFGAVVANWDVKPGVDGAMKLAEFTFRQQPAEVTRVTSKAPGTVAEDAITLQGSIDANNIPSLTWKESLTGDCDNNGEVNINDFSALGLQFRKTADPVDPADSEIRDCDFNKDGEVAITDIQKMGQNLKATLGGYWIKTGTTPGNLTDFLQLPRTVQFPDPRRQDGEEQWNWTGAALTADTYYQVEPYDREEAERGTPSENQVLLQPTTTVTYTDINIGFVGQATWPANRIASNGDYIIVVTENSADAIDGNAEPFAPESLQLVINAETDQNPGVPVDITSTAYMGLSEGSGLAAVSLASATRGKVTFKDRGHVTIQTFAPGDFTLSDTISFRLVTIDSLAINSGSGASPVSVGSGTNVQFTVTGTFDWDSDNTNGNEITQDLTSFCNWGVVPDTANTGSVAVKTDSGALVTADGDSGDSYTVYAEFPNTDDIRLYDNRKRSTAPFVVNIN
jgi:hypothetical protein